MWDDRYGAEEFAYGSEANDFLREQIERLPTSGHALDLAAGEGRNTIFLASLSRFERVLAVDQSAVGLEKAKKLAAEKLGKDAATVETETADLRTYDLGDAKWDVVTSIFAHTPPDLRQSLHRRVVQALKPGGVLVLEAYAPAQLKHGTGGPPAAEMLVSLENLRAELVGLDFVFAEELEREIQEGKFHAGLSAVTQLVAVKPAL